MAWTYSGDPAFSDKDKYRFLIGDTDEEEPVLQDEEIEYVIAEHEDFDMRLYVLFDSCTTRFAREYEIKIGPISEKPNTRLNYFKAKTKEYYNKVFGLTTTIPSAVVRPSSFWIGMHDG